MEDLFFTDDHLGRRPKRRAGQRRRHHRGHDAGRPSRRGLRFVQCARSEGIRGHVCAAQHAFLKKTEGNQNSCSIGSLQERSRTSLPVGKAPPAMASRHPSQPSPGPAPPAAAAAPAGRPGFDRDRARLHAGRRRLCGLRTGRRPGRSPAGRRRGRGRCDRVLQCGGLRPAGGQIPVQRRHLRLRADPAGRVARLHRGLGFRDGQDGVLRGDGPDVRPLCGAGLRDAAGGGRRRGPDRGQPARDHPDRAADPDPAGRGARHPRLRGGRRDCWARILDRTAAGAADAAGRAAGACFPRPG